MISQKPYLIKAIYHWIIDNNNTPMINIDLSTDNQGIILPDEQLEHYKNSEKGLITLNISRKSIRDLDFYEDDLVFNCSFNSSKFDCTVPYTSILQIYDKENKIGISFEKQSVENEINIENEINSEKGYTKIGKNVYKVDFSGKKKK